MHPGEIPLQPSCRVAANTLRVLRAPGEYHRVSSREAKELRSRGDKLGYTQERSRRWMGEVLKHGRVMGPLT